MLLYLHNGFFTLNFGQLLHLLDNEQKNIIRNFEKQKKQIISAQYGIFLNYIYIYIYIYIHIHTYIYMMLILIVVMIRIVDFTLIHFLDIAPIGITFNLL